MRAFRRFGAMSVVLGTITWLVAFSPSGRAAPPPPNSKIDHIVVLMQENRSADHYLGQLSTFDPTSGYEAEGNASNPNPIDPSAPPITAFHKTSYCEVADLDHSWNGSHAEYDNGAMDGFTAANVNDKDPTGSRTMGYYDQTDLPFYYGLYNTFATGDRYFQSVLSQTFPNRFYLLAGTSFGHIRNDFPPPNNPNAFSQRTIFENLDAAGISWKIYYAQIAFGLEFSYVRNHADHLVPIAQYYADAQHGTLPQVAYVAPVFISSANTETD